MTLKRWSEAIALYQRSQQYISEIKNVPDDLKKQVKDLDTAVEGSKFAAHAHHVLEGEVQEEDTILNKQQRTRKVHILPLFLGNNYKNSNCCLTSIFFWNMIYNEVCLWFKCLIF